MFCKVCEQEMKVVNNRNVLKGAGTEDSPIVLYTELTLRCRNPQCPQYEKDVISEFPQKVDSEELVTEIPKESNL